MAYSTLDNAFIMDLDDGTQFTFQFLPDSINDGKQATFDDYHILGRSSPLKGYQMGPSRTLEFVVPLFADPTADGPPKSVAQLDQEKNWLLSLPYPDYNGGIKPPHRLLVMVGSSITMECVCTSANAEFRRGIPWELGPGYAHGVYVALRFEEVKDVPLSLYDRRGGAG